MFCFSYSFDRNDTTLNVLPMSQVHVVCPNPSTVVMKVKDNTPKDRLYQNLWIVTREGHQHCNTNHGHGSRLLLRCNTPLTLKYFTLVFRKYSAAVGALVFKPGREYYLIGTYLLKSSSCHNNALPRIFVSLLFEGRHKMLAGLQGGKHF